jgi:hypothetical protein
MADLSHCLDKWKSALKGRPKEKITEHLKKMRANFKLIHNYREDVQYCRDLITYCEEARKVKEIAFNTNAMLCIQEMEFLARRHLSLIKLIKDKFNSQARAVIEAARPFMLVVSKWKLIEIKTLVQKFEITGRGFWGGKQETSSSLLLMQQIARLPMLCESITEAYEKKDLVRLCNLRQELKTQLERDYFIRDA